MNKDKFNYFSPELGLEPGIQIKTQHELSSQSIETQRQMNAVFETQYKYFTVLVLLGVILASVRIKETGLLTAYPVQWFSALGMILVVLMRNKISFQMRSVLISLLGLIYAGVGVFTYGLLGQGLLIMLFIGVIATLSGRPFHGYLITCVSIVLIIFAGISFQKNIFPISVNPSTYAVSMGAWITALITVLIVFIFEIITLGKVKELWFDNIRRVELSESKYRLLAENLSDIIWILDLERMIFTYISPSVQRMQGYTPEEIIPLPLEKFLKPESYEKMIKILKEELEIEGKPGIDPERSRTFEVQMIRKNGTCLWAEMSINFIRNIEDQPVGVIGVTRDITERKEVEDKLKEGEERYGMLFNSIKDAVFVHQPASDGGLGKYIEVNDVACKRYGYHREEFLNLSPLDISSSRQNNEDADHYTRKILAEKYGVFERIHKTRDNKEFPVEVSAYLFDFHGKPTIISIARDITERKRAEEEKTALETQLQQAQKMEGIGTLAGGIAHDFNNLLSPIMLHAELAMSDLPQNDPLQHSMKEIYKACLRARDLVKQILTFARKGSEEKIAMKSSLIIKDSIRFLRSVIPTTINIHYDTRTDQDTILADPTQVNQIIMNLCTNAAHAMNEKGGTLKVILDNEDISYSRATRLAGLKPGKYLKISVHDTGSGISPDFIGKIFEPYYTTKNVGEGTGLGLAIVHGIVKSYDGDIKVESNPGKGTTFHVYLPLVDTEILDHDDTTSDIQRGTESLLIVDDEKAAVDISCKMFEKLGYRVTAITSSIEALEVFRNNPENFDLVITDMTMPNMTGEDMAKEIMSIKPGIPVILCTGFSDKIDEKKAKAMGIACFIMKPIIISEIAKNIREVLDRK